MRYRLAAILCCVTLLVAGCALTLAGGALEGRADRCWQHEQAQQLADLPQEEQEAASSLSTDPKSFASHLPVVSINTGGVEIPGEPLRNTDGSYVLDEGGNCVYSTAEDGSESIAVRLEAFDAQGQANRLSDQPSLSERCYVHVRGNSSRQFVKKSYALRFADEQGQDEDVPFLGMEKSENWVLHGPCLDKTLLRNYLSYGLAGEFMSQYVPQTRFCELFIDGEYQGLYLAVETPKVQEGRIELTKADPRSAQTSWLVQVQPYEDDALATETFLEYTLRQRNATYVEYPPQTSITRAQLESIGQELSDFEKALYSFDYDTSAHGYWNYIDVQSFVDYYLMNEFAMNLDFGARSTFLHKDLRGKIVTGPVWDFNNCYGNFWDEPVTEGFCIIEGSWYYMLGKDEKFTEKVISRYRELREGPLSTERIEEAIDAAVDYLGPAVERNYKRWGVLFEPEKLDGNNRLQPLERNPRSYDEAVDQLKDWIAARGDWLDTYIENLRQYSHESMVKKFNH